MKHRAVLQQQFKQKQKPTENKSKCFDMKFIVIVIDEDYTSLKRKKRKQIENKTKRRHKIIESEKLDEEEKLVINNSECNWPHQHPSVTSPTTVCRSDKLTHNKTQTHTQTHSSSHSHLSNRISAEPYEGSVCCTHTRKPQLKNKTKQTSRNRYTTQQLLTLACREATTNRKQEFKQNKKTTRTTSNP
uniref:(northern house mosquito) hypothetical protein n=1 Tax=Culex pipiens TaxID=7175 RepID=A0A8D8AAJ4_CULPI